MASPQEVQVQERIEYQKGELIIKIHGELLNSDNPARRKLFIETTPTVLPNELVRVLEATKSWLRRFRYIFPTDTPWWYVSGCPFCKEAVLRNRENITSLNWWKTAHCLRHSAIYFVNIASVIDNKERVLRIRYERLVDAIIPTHLIYFTQTLKYMATYDINDRRAVVYWRKYGDNRVIKFVYRNHLDSYPLMSAYAILTLNLSRELFALLNEIDSPQLANVYLNGELIKQIEPNTA